MKILVTGAAGFIGMHACERLLREGHTVTGVDDLNPYYEVALKEARLARLQALPGFGFHRLTVQEPGALERVFEQLRPAKVLHLAAQAGVRHSLTDPDSYTRANLDGFVGVLQACAKWRVQGLVYASSSSVYGPSAKLPFREDAALGELGSYYAATKRCNELMAGAYADSFGLACTGLRFFSVYGPWGRPDMAPWIFSRAILAEQPIKAFNHGKMSRDMTFVGDAVEAILRVLAQPQGGKRILNVGNGKPQPLLGVVECLEGLWGKKAHLELEPLQGGELLDTCADTGALEAAIGSRPSTSMEDGLAAFVGWYRAYHA